MCIDKFEEGKLYRYSGIARGEGWNSEGDMDYLLEGGLHYCQEVQSVDEKYTDILFYDDPEGTSWAFDSIDMSMFHEVCTDDLLNAWVTFDGHLCHKYDLDPRRAYKINECDLYNETATDGPILALYLHSVHKGQVMLMSIDMDEVSGVFVVPELGKSSIGIDRFEVDRYYMWAGKTKPPVGWVEPMFSVLEGRPHRCLDVRESEGSAAVLSGVRRREGSTGPYWYYGVSVGCFVEVSDEYVARVLNKEVIGDEVLTKAAIVEEDEMVEPVAEREIVEEEEAEPIEQPTTGEESCREERHFMENLRVLFEEINVGDAVTYLGDNGQIKSGDQCIVLKKQDHHLKVAGPTGELVDTWLREETFDTVIKKPLPEAYVIIGHRCENVSELLSDIKAMEQTLRDIRTNSAWSGRVVGYKLTPVLEATVQVKGVQGQQVLQDYGHSSQDDGPANRTI